MSRIRVKFRKGYSRYNTGETAAFGKEEAEKLCKGKDPIAELVGPVEEASGSTVTVGLQALGVKEAVEAVGAEIRAEFKAKEQELAERAQELADREAALADREAALAEKEAATADPTGNGGGEASAAKEPKTAGAPPKQGAKK